jgi:hypothetical protein
MADTDFILEHEILKALYEKTSMYIGGYTRGDGKQIVLGKRDYNIVSLPFGTLVDMMNNPKRYADPNIAFNGFDLFQNEIKTDKYSIGKVSNAIEVLVSNEHVIDEYIKHEPPLKSGSRKIVLTPKGAIDYRDDFYVKKKETDSLDIKIKRITVSNTKTTRIIAIASLIVSISVGAVTIIRYLDERNKSKVAPTTEQIDSLLQLNQKSSENLQTIQNKMSHADTSIKRVKIVR